MSKTARVIWKFPLIRRGWNEIGVGDDSRVVHTGIDPASGQPTVWIEHRPDAGPHQRAFGVFPTGGTIAENAAHVGSLIDGQYVWHIYERQP